MTITTKEKQKKKYYKILIINKFSFLNFSNFFVTFAVSLKFIQLNK